MAARGEWFNPGIRNTSTNAFIGIGPILVPQDR